MKLYLQLNYGRDIIEYYLKKISFKNVVDLGAGNGEDLAIAKKINRQAKLIAIENYGPYVKDLVSQGVECLDISIENQKIPLEDNSVDVIIANQSLEHVKELFWIFHEVNRTLKKNGYFIVGVPNLAGWHNRLFLLAGFQPTCITINSAHIRGFTKSGLKKFAEIGHMKLVEFKGSNFYPFPEIIAKRLSRLFPTLSVGAFFLFQKTKYKDEFLKYPAVHRLETNYFVGD